MECRNGSSYYVLVVTLKIGALLIHIGIFYVRIPDWHCFSHVTAWRKCLRRKLETHRNQEVDTKTCVIHSAFLCYMLLVTDRDRTKEKEHITHKGPFKITVMPFGLHYIFQYIQEIIETTLVWCLCITYLHDIIVFGHCLPK